MGSPHKIDDQNPKKPPTANSSFQPKKLYWLWEKVWINISWLGKYNSFFIFTTQFFPTSLKIMIPIHNIKRKKNFFLNINHGEKLCFTEFNTTWIDWNRSLVASGLLFLFTQSNKFSKFNWHMLRKRLFMKLTEKEERLLLSAGFTAKFELGLVLTQENALS